MSEPYLFYVEPKCIHITENSNQTVLNTISVYAYRKENIINKENYFTIVSIALKVKKGENEHDFSSKEDFGLITYTTVNSVKHALTLNYHEEGEYLVSENIPILKPYITVFFNTVTTHALEGTTPLTLRIEVDEGKATYTTYEKEVAIVKQRQSAIIQDFHAVSGMVPFHQQVLLQWTVENAKKVTLQVNKESPIEVTNKTTYTFSNIKESSIFTLKADQLTQSFHVLKLDTYIKEFQQYEDTYYWDVLSTNILKLQEQEITEYRGNKKIEDSMRGHTVHLMTYYKDYADVDSYLYIPKKEECDIVKHFEKVIFQKGKHKFLQVKWHIVNTYWERFVYKDRERLNEICTIYDSTIIDPVKQYEQDGIITWEQVIDEIQCIDITLEYQRSASDCINYITI